MKKKTCKNCIHYSGIECHGHGDFWGTCYLLMNCYKDLKSTYDSIIDCDLDCFNCICYDDSICKFYEILKEKENVKKDSNNNKDNV